MKDRGSISMVLMITLAGTLLAGLMLPMLITQARGTRLDGTRVRALDAAQAGVDAALGRIRVAVDDGGIGTSAELPCGPLSGSVDDADPAAYTVTIAYYTVDPVTSPTATPMVCADGYGTFDPASGQSTPSYAQLAATGTDGSGPGATRGRTLVTTYVVKTSNTNVPGGVVRIYPAAGATTALCLDAGSATPAAGASVTLQPCSTSTPPAAAQVFVYRTDLTVQLLSSITSAYPNGLCLDTAAPPTAGNPVTLATCRAPGSPTYTQQWSFDDWGAYRASLSTSRTDGKLATVCLNVAGQAAGQPLTLASCAQNTSSPTQAWVPAPSVGAGGAAPPQLINYLEFGRCLDVTGQNVNADHLIDYPCKQDPWAGAVAWNQKFSTPPIGSGQSNATGQVVTTTSSTNYCLTSPGTAGGYVTVKTCSATNAAQRWTVYSGDRSLPYSTKYTMVDSSGRCLALTQPVTGEQWSAIDVEQCTGATEQKWNAAANLAAPALQNTAER